YLLKEEDPVGTVVGNVSRDAFTDTTHSFNNFTFKFFTTPSIAISIDEFTGVISVQGRIDREAICGNSGGTIGGDVAVYPVEFFRIVKVIIVIEDINDNDPVFGQDRIVWEVSESSPVNHTSLIIGSAIDADVGYNSVVKYEMTKLANEVTKNGIKLVLIRPLDRESVEEYFIRIVAYDGGSPVRSGAANITVVVIDANDNKPNFEFNSYEVSTVENTPIESTIARVTAHDPDAGPNGQISYHLGPSSQASYGDVFRVDELSGEVIVVGNVDYERGSENRLLIIAIDGGSEPLSSETTVIIKVEDVNDNAPQIVVNSLAASNARVAEIEENQKTGTFVCHVTVNDIDSSTSGRFSCSLIDGSVGSDGDDYDDGEYHIVSNQVFDRESSPTQVILIKCKDQGEPAQTTIKKITVNILDVNDHAPVFLNSFYETDITENNLIGAEVEVGQLAAIDPDEPPNNHFRFSFKQTSNLAFIPSEYFRLDGITGRISALVSFDREATPQFSFQVIVADAVSEKMSNVATVYVSILDVNDCTPVFTFPSSSNHTLHVYSNARRDKLVAIITASDDDEGAN
ncbi:hypothetical protein HELRODRAFT_120472, partial [Helobdella robusta]|uniref:Cadherin domain-containing protein n=1 Tax=Helobdella robusta TaxID=6412 RepID=T1EGQ0_HELRO